MLRLIKIISYLTGTVFILNILIGLIFFPFEKKIRLNLGQISLGDEKIRLIEINDRSELKEFLYYNFVGNFYDYENFVGWKERIVKSKYFNVDKNGRYTPNRPNKCKRKIIIYGSSISFGYLSKDENTIASFIQKNLIESNYKNVCVYNYGIANFTSYRENLLLKKHIINKIVNKNDIIIFLDGTAELLPSSLIFKIEMDMKNESNTFYKNFFYNLNNFLKTTPMIRIYDMINRKLTNGDKKLKVFNQSKIDSLVNEKLIFFKSNLEIRQVLCKNYKLNCFTFIEPNGYLRDELKEIKIVNQKTIFFGKNLVNFHNKIKNLQEVINISSIIDYTNNDNFIDDLHLSSLGSQIVAKEIFSFIEEKLN